MNRQQRNHLTESWHGKVSFDVSMAEYSTLRAGGRAAALLDAHSTEELHRLLVFLEAEQIECITLGRGSNILFADSGYSGAVIRLKGEFEEFAVLRRSEEGAEIKAGAGCALGKLVSWCSKQGLAGLEFLVGIPGSVGGAVRMNAGAWGQEIGARLREIELVDERGAVRQVPASELRLSYRNLALADRELGRTIISAASLRLMPDREEAIRDRCAAYLARRKGKQPAGVASAGSFFKNPPGDFAGRLIEAAGLKGASCGSAMVSPVHANFLVNTGGATATEILALMERVRTEVAARFGVWLEPEVHIIQETQ